MGDYEVSEGKRIKITPPNWPTAADFAKAMKPITDHFNQKFPPVNTENGIPWHEILTGCPVPEKKQGMKLVYVAGPYRAETREGVAQNVAAARHVGRLCVRKGWFPILPTVNTAHFDHDFPGLADDDFWRDGTMELMRRCDAVVLVDGWQYSSGAHAEIKEARKIGLKVYLSSNVLPQLEKVTA